MARNNGEACVQIFFIRNGKLIGREYFILEGTEDSADNEVMSEFIKQFYTEAASVPEQVMLPQEIEETKIIGEWLRSKRGGRKMEFFVPKEGQPQELVKMAAENATETLLRGLQTVDAGLQRGFVTVQAQGRLQVRVEGAPATLQTTEWQGIPRALQQGLKLVVGETYVFISSHMKARELIASGEIGRPLQIRERHGAWLNRQGGMAFALPADRTWRLTLMFVGLVAAVIYAFAVPALYMLYVSPG